MSTSINDVTNLRLLLLANGYFPIPVQIRLQ